MPATYDSTSDLALALRRAEEDHGRYGDEIGHPDPDWYAQFRVDGQSGRPGKANPEAST